MSTQPVVNICIEVERNSLGIDFGLIALTPEVLAQLRLLHSLVVKHKLLTINTDKIPINFYKADCLQTSRHSNYFEFSSLGGATDFALSFSVFFMAELDADDISQQFGVIKGCWHSDLTALNAETLVEMADERGDVHVCDNYEDSQLIATSDLLVKSRDVEFKHDILQFLLRWPTPKLDLDIAPYWPNPFHFWGPNSEPESRSHRRLPRMFIRAHRSRQATDTLGMLFFIALKEHPDPNDRCAIYTLAAAIIICPDEVELTQIVEADAPPVFNRSRDLEPIGESPLTDGYFSAPGPICPATGKQLGWPNRKVRIRYKTLMGVLHLDRFEKETVWTTHTSHRPNLALLYEDHANNEVAKYWLNEHQRVNRADHSRLILLAYGLDAVKRLFADGEPWWEDMKKALDDIPWFDDDMSKKM